MVVFVLSNGRAYVAHPTSSDRDANAVLPGALGDAHRDFAGSGF